MDWRFAIMVTIFAWGLQAVLLKYFVSNVSLRTLVFVAWFVGSLAGLVYFLLSGWNFPDLALSTAGLVVLIGALAVVGYLGFMYALSLAPATVVLPLSSLNVAFAVFLSALLFKEPLSARELAGLVLALVAVVLLAA